LKAVRQRAFARESFRQAAARRRGVARDDRHLYPAFPYDHFTRLADDDVRALYAYVMTRDPVRATPPGNDLVFPLQFRPLLAGWKLLYLDEGPRRDVRAGSGPSERGAYLVDTIAHCRACHTPRNASARKCASATSPAARPADGMPPLDASSPSPMPWTADELFVYLRTGIVRGHAMAAGPMRRATRRSSSVTPSMPARARAATRPAARRRRRARCRSRSRSPWTTPIRRTWSTSCSTASHRSKASIDGGETVSPDGIFNPVEGGVVQSLSWWLFA
jgi:mono/diheme cytochrome c family protein